MAPNVFVINSAIVKITYRVAILDHFPKQDHTPPHAAPALTRILSADVSLRLFWTLNRGGGGNLGRGQVDVAHPSRVFSEGSDNMRDFATV
jgi:hypothetical protein